MKRRFQIAFLCAALVGALAPLHAQTRARVRLIRAQQERTFRQEGQGRPLAQQRPQNGAGPGANTLPPRAFQRLQNMTPQQQERFLENNQRFQNLSQEQQVQIRQRLQAWNKLSPEQQQELRVRQQIWEEMTPAQRRNVQQVLLPRWQQLPADRRQAITERLHALRDLSEPGRDARLNDPTFLQGLNGDDRDMLRQLAHLHVGMAPDAPGF